MSTNPRPSLDLTVTLFPRANDTTPSRQTKLGMLLQTCSTKPGMLDQSERIAELARKEDQGEYTRMKEGLYGFVLGDLSVRSMAGVNRLAKAVALEIDALPSESMMAAYLEQLKEWEFCAAAWPSPSRKGIRIIVLTRTDDKEGFTERYRQCARAMCKFLRLPIKRDVRMRMTAAGFTTADAKRFLDITPHGDDMVGDYARLWFITGIPPEYLFINPYPIPYTEPKPVKEKGYGTISGGGGVQGDPQTVEELVETLTAAIEAGGVDITAGVREWHKVGQSIYAAIGAAGRDYFLRISRFHPDFKQKDASREWDRISAKHNPAAISAGSLVYMCRDYGIEAAGTGVGGGSEETALLRLGVRAAAREDPTMAETERSVVATLVYHPESFGRIADEVPGFCADCISTTALREVYQTVRILRSEDRPVDPATVAALTSQRGFAEAGAAVLTFQEQKYFPETVAEQARILYDEWRYARLNAMGPDLAAAVGKRLPVDDVIASAKGALDQMVSSGNRQTEYNSFDVTMAITKHMKRMKKMRQQGIKIEGISTGLTDLDRVLSGLVGPRLYILAARPAMGKTSFALCLILAALMQGLRVVFFSAEMSLHDVSLRFAALMTDIELPKIQQGRLTDDEWVRVQQALNVIGEFELIVDDDGSITADQMSAKLDRHVRNGGVDLWVCDYLQYLAKSNKKHDDREAVEYSSRMCKDMCKRHNIPGVALSQLSRSVETRGGDKRPQLSDLRQTGAIEQDADIVMFLYRPEYYKITEDEQGNSLAGVAEVIVGKNRHGDVLDVKCRFIGVLTKFEDLPDPDFDLLPKKKTDAQDAPAATLYGSGPLPVKMNTDEDIPY